MPNTNEKRLIDANALLNRKCHEAAKGNCKECDWYGDSWCRCEIFGVEISQIPTVDFGETVQKWIPVTERLPDLIPCSAGTAYSEGVIVWTSGRKAMIAVWDGIDFLCAADYWEAWGEKITHWMPLPLPPRGD